MRQSKPISRIFHTQTNYSLYGCCHHEPVRMLVFCEKPGLVWVEYRGSWLQYASGVRQDKRDWEWEKTRSKRKKSWKRGEKKKKWNKRDHKEEAESIKQNSWGFLSLCIHSHPLIITIIIHHPSLAYRRVRTVHSFVYRLGERPSVLSCVRFKHLRQQHHQHQHHQLNININNLVLLYQQQNR